MSDPMTIKPSEIEKLRLIGFGGIGGVLARAMGGRFLGRFVKEGLIVKGDDGVYSLTTVGKAAL